MGAKIRHEGIVKNISGNVVSVLFVQQSACAHCEAKGHCNAAESKEKIIDIDCENPQDYTVGDRVVVMASQKVGFLAVLYGAVLPTIVLLVTVITTALTTGDEPLAALLGIAALAIYFLFLYIIKDRLRRQLRFTIA